MTTTTTTKKQQQQQQQQQKQQQQQQQKIGESQFFYAIFTVAVYFPLFLSL